MTDSIRRAVQAFFEQLPEGRLDSIYVSGSLCTADYAKQMCSQLRLHCTFKAQTGQYRFERLAWKPEHLEKFQVIIA